MNVEELLDAGQLTAAIEQLDATLRSRPTDLKSRTLLFELLCFAGAWDRAGRQLDVIGHQDPEPTTQVGLKVYRSLLEAEQRRARLFADGTRPRFVLEPSAAIALHLEALDRLRDGQTDEARALRDQAAAEMPSVRGRIGETPFDEWRDADDRLAPVLEVFASGGYYWVPWEQIQYLEVGPPRRLRDLLWAPARLACFDGQLGEVYLPVLYPGSARHADAIVRLGRKTEWLDAGAGLIQGQGLKMLLVGDDARTLLDIGEVQFTPPSDPDPTTSGA